MFQEIVVPVNYDDGDREKSPIHEFESMMVRKENLKLYFYIQVSIGCRQG